MLGGITAQNLKFIEDKSFQVLTNTRLLFIVI